MQGRSVFVVTIVALVVAFSAGLVHADWQADFQKLKSDWAAQAKSDGLTYAKAQEQVSSVWNQYQEAEGLIQFAEQFGEDADQLPKFRQQRDAASAKMVPALKAAVGLAPQPTDANRQEIVEALHRLCVMLYQAGDFKSSVAVAEHLGHNFAETPEGLHGTTVALSCYAQFYNQAPADKKREALEPLMDLNAYIARQWPNQQEGRDALARLAQLALQSGDAARARSVAQQLPADSPQRGEIQLHFALQDYTEYARLRALPANDPQKPSAQEMGNRRSNLVKSMQEAVDQARKANRDSYPYSVLAAEYALAGFYNEDGKFDQAQKLLEQPSGLLDRANTPPPPSEQPAFPEAVYQLALDTYVSQGQLEKALNILDKLAGTGSNPAAVTTKQLDLANRLFTNLKERWSAGDSGAGMAQQLAGLTKLLSQISERDAGHSVKSRTWVAQAMYELAEAADPQGGSLPNESVQDMYRSAQTAYDKLMRQIQNDPAEAARVNWARIRMANILRRTGDFPAAIELVERVLRDAEKNLEAQFVGAYTYQDWGVSASSNEYFRYALDGGPARRTAVGDVPSPILGWKRLVGMLQSSTQHRMRYYEARYNLAMSTRNLGLTSATDEDRRKLLESAQSQIIGLHRYNPDLGSPQWKERFEVLLRSIQTALGQPESGLPAQAE